MQMQKILSGITTLAFALAVLVVGAVVYKNRNEASPLVCGSDQINVVFDDEQSLANLLALHRPDVAVGTVAKDMKLDPTVILHGDGKGYCITVGTKKAKSAKSNDNANKAGSADDTVASTSKLKSDSAVVSPGN